MGGILDHSGYFLGDNLYPPRDTNPTGFFENAYINGINEDILMNVDFVRLNLKNPLMVTQYSPFQPGYGQRWLSFILPEKIIQNSDEGIGERIRYALSCKGFAYKDPRFNYTLGVWNSFLPEDTMFICLFRQPDIVVASVIKECRTADYLHDFSISEELAFQLWMNNYSHILTHYFPFLHDRMIFVHYSQILDGTAIPRIEASLEVTLETSLISRQLNRSRPTGRIPRDAQILYEQLCNLAGVSSLSMWDGT